MLISHLYAPKKAGGAYVRRHPASKAPLWS
jgi:hypothetical protein